MKSLNTILGARPTGIGFLLLLVMLVSGCGGGAGYGSGGGYMTPVALTSIAIVPNSAMLSTGMGAGLRAIGSYSNGTTADITSSVTWASTTPATATVGSGSGVVTGVAAGATGVTASVSGLYTYNTITSPAASVTVTSATLTGITIAPLTMSVGKGGTTSFTATGSFSDSTSGNISGSVGWSTSDSAVAAVNSVGVASGVGVGSCSIMATLNSISNIATLTVL